MSGIIQTLLASHASGGGAGGDLYFGTFTAQGSTGTQDITGIGYTPSLVIMWTNGQGADGLGGADVSYIFSACIPGGNFIAWGCKNEDGSDPTEEDTVFRSSTYPITHITNNAGTEDPQADAITGISDGFRINWVGTPSWRFGFIAFPPNLDVAVGTIDTGTSTGTGSVSGLGFQPKFVMFSGVNMDSTSEGATPDSSPKVGFGVDATTRHAAGAFSNDAVGTTQCKIVSTTSGCYIGCNDTVVDLKIDYNGPTPDGFEYDVETAPASDTRLGYIAVGGAIEAFTGAAVSGGSTGDLAITGVGFQPDIVYTAGFGDNNTDTLRGGWYTTMGASDGSNHYVISGGQNDGSATNSTNYRQQNSSNILIGRSGAGTLFEYASLSSMDSDGFTLNYPSAIATVGCIYLALRITDNS